MPPSRRCTRLPARPLYGPAERPGARRGFQKPDRRQGIMTRVLSAKRFDTMAAAKGKPSNGKPASRVNLEEVFGENTFSMAERQARLPKPVFKALMRTLDQGSELEPQIADAVAVAM